MKAASSATRVIQGFLIAWCSSRGAGRWVGRRGERRRGEVRGRGWRGIGGNSRSFDRRASLDGDADRVPAGGAVGERVAPLLGLGLAVAVGGPHRDRVQPRIGGVPREGPLTPGVVAERLGQLGGLPLAVVDAHLHPLDAAGLGPRHPAEHHLAGADAREAAGGVDAAHGADRCPFAVAPGHPVAVEGVEGRHLDLGEPLHRRQVAVDAGRDEADGEAVAQRERLAVHADRDDRVPVVGRLQGSRRCTRRSSAPRSGRPVGPRRPRRAGPGAGSRATGRCR